MTTIVKYTFEGKAKDFKLAHIPPNGGVVTVRLDGVDFEVKMLHGVDARKRLFMARKVASKVNEFVWDWRLGSMEGLRQELQYTAKLHNEYVTRREQFLKSQGINLQPVKPFGSE